MAEAKSTKKDRDVASEDSGLVNTVQCMRVNSLYVGGGKFRINDELDITVKTQTGSIIGAQLLQTALVANDRVELCVRGPQADLQAKSMVTNWPDFSLVAKSKTANTVR